MESLAQLLRRTIQTGTPLYNQGHPARCLQVYTQAARDSLDASDELAQSETGKLLQAALEQANRPDTDPAKGAWILRRCFDEILDAAEEQEFDQNENDNNPSVASTSSWQDEPTRNTTVDEKAQSLVDTAYILRSGVVVTDYVLGDEQRRQGHLSGVGGGGTAHTAGTGPRSRPGRTKVRDAARGRSHGAGRRAGW